MDKAVKVALGVAGASLGIYLLTRKAAGVPPQPPPVEYPCPYCGEVFYSQEELAVHIELEHGGTQEYCMYCGETFLTEQELSEHCKTTHADMCAMMKGAMSAIKARIVAGVASPAEIDMYNAPRWGCLSEAGTSEMRAEIDAMYEGWTWP